VLVLVLVIAIVLVLIFVPWSGCDCWLSIIRQSIELLPAIEHDDDCESESESEHEHGHEFRIVRAEARYSEPFPLISAA
jgi:hypothetical protein